MDKQKKEDEKNSKDPRYLKLPDAIHQRVNGETYLCGIVLVISIPTDRFFPCSPLGSRELLQIRPR